MNNQKYEQPHTYKILFLNKQSLKKTPKYKLNNSINLL
jgi:hypothetical protein